MWECSQFTDWPSPSGKDKIWTRNLALISSGHPASSKKNPHAAEKIREAWGYISLISKTRQRWKKNYPFRAAVTFFGCLSIVRTAVEFIASTVASSMPKATRRRRCTFTRWALAPADFVGRLLLGLRCNVVLDIIVFRFVVKNWKNRLVDRLESARSADY